MADSSIDGWQQIDAVCDRFEDDWQADRQPLIEDFMTELRVADRSTLLRELLRIEFEYRRQRGEQILATEYQSRFPHDSDLLTELLVENTLDNWPRSSITKDPSGKLPLVPGYDVLGELGHGGMGVVYEARQVRLNRTVALKMILGSAHVDADLLARFQREAEAVAKVQHPNIVQIYEIGDHDGLPFFSLEYVEGGSLDRLVSGEPFPLRDVAGLVETISRAMHFAHEHGIIHRDLKPANILLARSTAAPATPASAESTKPHAQAELSTVPDRPRDATADSPSARPDSRPSLADFVPKITDFGLAKQLKGNATSTLSGAVMGTPSYMAPEQAAGRTREIGPLADVYALGAILYHLLTGRPPFRAESVMDTLRLVIESDPISPRLLNPTLDRDLETICLKCLSKEATRRYATASELADDLRRYQNREPIHARPVPRLERA
jgi:serine/threonine protein kinase